MSHPSMDPKLDQGQMLATALTQAQCAIDASDHGAAVLHATLARDLAQSRGELDALASAEQLLLDSLFAQGQLTPAIAHGLAAIDLWGRLGQTAQECACGIKVSGAFAEHNQPMEGLDHARKAFDLAHGQGLQELTVQALSRMGALHGRLDDLENAERLLLQGLSHAREFNDQHLFALALLPLLSFLVSLHDEQRANGQTTQAAATSHRMLLYGRFALGLGEDFMGSGSLTTVQIRSAAAMVLAAKGHFQEAQVVLLRCIQLAEDHGSHLAEIKCRHRYATCLMRSGDDAAAAVQLQSLLTRIRPDDHPLARVEAERDLAQIARRAVGKPAEEDDQAPARRGPTQRVLLDDAMSAELQRNCDEVLSLLERR